MKERMGLFAVTYMLLTWVITACLSIVLATPAYGQVVQSPDSEEQRRRAQSEAIERQQLLQQPRVELSVEQPKLLDTEPLPNESPCYPLQQISLQVAPQLSNQTKQLGASELPLDPFFFAQAYLQRYVGLCVGQVGLNLILQRVANVILQNGYSTTRVGLNEQDLSYGQLTLSLVPGVIHALRLSDPSSDDGMWRYAFPTGPGQLLNLRNLEQGLEQLKRVSNQEVTMQIVPGELPGESDIVLTIRRNKAWTVSASVDNSGAKGTGQLQAGANLLANNLLGISDVLNVGINTDANRTQNDRGTRGHNLSYAVPLGYWNFSVAASDYDYHQTIAGNTQSFISSGSSQNFNFKISHLFQRNQTQKSSWQINLGKRWAHAFIDDTEIEVQKRNVTFAELAWVHQHYLGRAQLDLTLANRWGTGWFGGQQDFPHLPQDFPTFQYTIQTLDASLNIPIRLANRFLNYNATLRAQTSPSNLYVADQFSIGGRYTVRGFDGELTLAAEKGFYLRNELTIPIADSTYAIYAGIDIGKVFGPSARYLVGDKLAGAAIGLRGSTPYFNYDLFSSWPLYRSDQFNTTIPSIGFNVSVQY